MDCFERLRNTIESKNALKKGKKGGAEDRGPLTETPCVRAGFPPVWWIIPSQGCWEAEGKGAGAPFPTASDCLHVGLEPQALVSYDKSFHCLSSAPCPTLGA